MTKEQIEKAAEAWVDANHPKSMVFIETTLVAFAVEQVNAALEDAARLTETSLHPRNSLPREIRSLKVKP